jgi:hypothetical protein
MSGQTAEESLMATRLVEALSLDHIKPEAIAPTAPLFGSSNEGIGLDSIRRCRNEERLRLAAYVDRPRVATTVRPLIAA